MIWPLECVRAHEPLANHTSFRIGGPAEWFAEPATLEELVEVLRTAQRVGLPVSILGGGTNTLVADRGVRGLLVHLGRGFRMIQDLAHPEDPLAEVRCGSALLTQRLVYLAARHGWGGLEILAGLPGHVGGAVVMNAQDIGRFVHHVSLVTWDGSIRHLSRQHLHFSYRYTALEPGIVTDVMMRFPKVSPHLAYEQIRNTLRHRNATQDVRLPSAGCAF